MANRVIMEEAQEFTRESVTMPDVNFNLKGITANWSAVAVILIGVLGIGGGSFSALHNTKVTPESVAKAISVEVEKESEEHEKEHEKLNENIGVIVTKIDSVIKNQHWQKAEKEADRVCCKIPKWKREACVKHLLQKNMDRLEKGKSTCANVDCTN